MGNSVAVRTPQPTLLPEAEAIGDAFLKSRAESVRSLLKQLPKLASMSVPVLVTGESGVGKEVLARAIHDLSDRSDAPFVAVNCAAIPGPLLEAELFGHARGAFTGAHKGRVGKFAAAGDGTLLLDEVGDLPLDLQAKLLRAVQERCFEPLGSNESIPVRARLLSATSRNLRDAIGTSNFRLDLYYRLAVVTLEVPPLRRRLEDLPRICAALLERHCNREGLPLVALQPELYDLMRRYEWPGNIRELENVLIASAVASDGPIIDTLLLPTVPMRQPDLSTAGMLLPLPRTADQITPLDECERMIIDAALQAVDGNLSECARRLGIGRATLRRKIARGLSS